MEDLHEPLYGNILLVGGNAMFPNLKERLESELRIMAPANYDINVVTPRKYVERKREWEGRERERE